jgi:hypothetical protein
VWFWRCRCCCCCCWMKVCMSHERRRAICCSVVVLLLCRSCAHFPCVYSLPPSNYAHDFIILFFVRICCLNGKQIMWPQTTTKENRNRI